MPDVRWFFPKRDRLTREDYKRLCPLAKAGNLEARDMIAESNLGLVYTHVRRLEGHGVAQEDLFSVGALGLLKAAVMYDPDNGTGFAHYASYWINAEMMKEIKVRGRTIRIPDNKHDLLVRFRQERGREYDRTGREMSLDEYMGAAKNGLDAAANLEQSHDALKVDGPLPSLEKPVHAESRSHGREVLLKDTIPNGSFEEMEYSLNTDKIQAYMQDIMKECLTEREIDIVNGRLDDELLETVGGRWKISRERARQIESEAYWKICRKIISRGHLESLASDVGASSERLEKMRRAAAEYINQGEHKGRSWGRRIK